MAEPPPWNKPESQQEAEASPKTSSGYHYQPPQGYGQGYGQAMHQPRYMRYADAQPTNGMGLTGMILGIISFFTAGLTSIPGLIFSFLGLRKPNKAMAIVGIVLNLLGILIAVGVGFMIYWMFVAINTMQQTLMTQQNQTVTMETIYTAQEQIQNRYDSTDTLPEPSRINDLMFMPFDAWGKEIKYVKIDERTYHLISAGEDMMFDTGDDIIHIVDADDPPQQWDPWETGYTTEAESTWNEPKANNLANAQITRDNMDTLSNRIISFHTSNDRFPMTSEFKNMTKIMVDGYDEYFRFNIIDNNTFELISNGPDTLADTSDDISRRYTLPN